MQSILKHFKLFFLVIPAALHKLFYSLFRHCLDQKEAFVKQLAGARGAPSD